MSNSNNETFTIQAGQIGIISKTHALDTTLDTDCVEVTFWSMSLGKLIQKSKELSFSSLNQDSVGFFLNLKHFHIFLLYNEVYIQIE
jgi:hypothetical protein